MLAYGPGSGLYKMWLPTAIEEMSKISQPLAFEGAWLIDDYMPSIVLGDEKEVLKCPSYLPVLKKEALSERQKAKLLPKIY